MLAWIKRLFGARSASQAAAITRAVPKSTTAPAGTTPAMSLSAPQPAVKAEAAAPALAEAPSPSRDGNRVIRRALKSDVRAATPAIGTPARVIAPGKAVKATILAVQSGGRRILARQNGGRVVQAFTLRPDRTYRLAGASDASVTQLLIE